MMWRIGELAKLIGRHPVVIRKYEKAGLIPTARRDPVNGFRVWTEEEVLRIQEQFQPVKPQAGRLTVLIKRLEAYRGRRER